MTILGVQAFYEENQLKAIILSNQLKIIGESAFSGTKLKEITIPKSVTTIENRVFLNSSNLENIVFEVGSNLSSLGYAIIAGTAITSFKLVNDVNIIDIGAFVGADKLVNIEIIEEVCCTH